jgi:threonine/homoserine/homoserine lactone efflux protein
MLYAYSGSTLRGLMQKEHHIKFLNKLAALLMAGIGIWLIVE